MKVVIVGTGYVGLTTGVVLGFIGHQVLCVDTNPSVVATLSKGTPTIHEPGLEELMALAAPNMRFSSEIPDLTGYDIVMIAVGTPSLHNGEVDLQYVENAVRDIARKFGENPPLLVTKSTVPIGTASHVQALVKSAHSHLDRIAVASNPEFLAEGRAVYDSLYPDRILIGVDQPKAADLLQELYRPLVDQTFQPPAGTPRPKDFKRPEVLVTSTRSSELSKYAANSFLATKISFINEFAGLAELVGADIREVSRAIGLDARIGSQFLKAGVGWGGSCFGKDTAAVSALARSYGYEMILTEAAVKVNNRQKLSIVRKLQRNLRILRGKTIAVLGVAFKPETNDVRDAPSLMIVKSLHELGCRVHLHDPVALDSIGHLLEPDAYLACSSALEACRDADAVVLVTDWREYLELDFSAVLACMRGNCIVDGRNVLPVEMLEGLGFVVDGVGY